MRLQERAAHTAELRQATNILYSTARIPMQHMMAGVAGSEMLMSKSFALALPP